MFASIRREDRLALGLLTLLTLGYALKFFHTNFIAQTDVFLNWALWHTTDWIEPNWDPITLGYSGWYPISAKLFPSVLLLRGIGKLFFPNSVGASLTLLLIQSAFAFWLFAVASYGFFRYLRISPQGAVAATIVSALAGFLPYSSLRETNFFYSLSTAGLLCLLITLHRASVERTRYWTLVSGFIVGLSLLGGSNFPLFFYLPCLPLIWLMDESPVWKQTFAKTFRASVSLAGALFIGLAIGAFHLIPGLRYLSFSNRDLAMGPSANRMVELSWTDFFSILTRVPVENPNFTLWVFPPVFVFVALGVWAVRKNRRGLFFLILVLSYVSIWLVASGFASPIRSLFFEFQRLLSLRMIGTRFAVLFLVGIAYFMARGWDLALHRFPKIGWIFVCALFYFYAQGNPDIPLYGRQPTPLADSIKFVSQPYPPGVFNSDYRMINFRDRRNLWAYSEKQSVGFDPWFDTSAPKRLTMLANAVLMYPFSFSNGDFPPGPPPINVINFESPLFDLYNVRYLLFPFHQTVGPEVLRTPFERAFWTPQARAFATVPELFEALRTATRQDLAKHVYLVRSQAEGSTVDSKAEIKVREKARDRWEVDVTADGPGYLNLSELWFPAWRAYLDGQEVPLLEGYGTFWSVAVPEGRHRISFHYSERFWWLGLAVTVLSLVIVGLGLKANIGRRH